MSFNCLISDSNDTKLSHTNTKRYRVVIFILIMLYPIFFIIKRYKENFYLEKILPPVSLELVAVALHDVEENREAPGSNVELTPD